MLINVYTFALLFLFLCTIFESDKSSLKLNGISNRIIFSLLAVYLVLLSGLRYGIETDYWSYEKIFREITDRHDADYYIEKGYTEFVRLYKNIFKSNNFNGFVFFLAVCSMGMKVFYFSKLKDPFVALFFYFLNLYIMCEFNGVRQGLAICFLFFAGEQIEKKNFIKFLFWIFIAVQFHTSSLLFFPMYFFCRIKMTKKKIFFLLLVAVILSAFMYPVCQWSLNILPLPQGIQVYAKRALGYLMAFTSEGKIISLGFLRYILVAVLLCFILGKRGIQSSYFKITFCGILIFLIFFRNTTLAYRLSESFVVFISPLLGCGIRKRNLSATFSLAVLILLYVALFFVSLRNGCALPYKTYFMGGCL